MYTSWPTARVSTGCFNQNQELVLFPSFTFINHHRNYTGLLEDFTSVIYY